MTRLRIVLGDRHYLRREGLRRLLAESGEAEVVAVAGREDALLDAVGGLRPDAVVTSIAAHQIRQEHPRVGVVVLDRAEQPALALLRQGLAGLAYLVEERVGDLGEVLRAVREVVAGRSVVDPSVVEALLHQTPITTLTRRELDVVRHMAEGRTNRAIAEALVLAESTVEKHVNTTFAKLGLGDNPRQHRRVAAVLAYLRHHES